MRQAVLAGALLLAANTTMAADPVVVPVSMLATAPVVDGDLNDWGKDGWLKIPIVPAVAAADRTKYGLAPEDSNATGKLTVQLKAGVAEGRLFLALRWPDDTEDNEYKGWEWNGIRYVEGKKRDDMAAVRFHLKGDFDRSMLSAKTYDVDVWLWSAARSNPLGLAEDWAHHFSTGMTDSAAEYEVKGVGTVYIKKVRDDGDALYKNVRPPKQKSEAKLDSFTLNKTSAGSVADVSAKGKWAAKIWSLELSRKLDTGYADDVKFQAGGKILGQLAIWNRGSDEAKSVSEPLLFDFSAVK
jgi:hypothetical protein